MMSLARKPLPSIDSTPEVVVKIIGSKYVKHIVEKPKRNSHLENCVEPQSQIIHDKDHGKACLSHQIISSGQQQQNIYMKENESTVYSDESKFHINEDYESQNIKCVTAPTGDQTLSYIHALRKPPQRLANCNVHQENNGVGFHQAEAELPYPEDTSDHLLSIIRDQLGSYSLSQLETIRVMLSSIDAAHSGFIHQSPLSIVLLRHDLPLKLSTLRLLFEAFSSTADPEMVQYENFLAFLWKSLTNADTIISPQIPINSSIMPDTAAATKQLPLMLPEQDKLHCKLEQSSKQHAGVLSMEDLRESFQAEDITRHGLLPQREGQEQMSYDYENYGKLRPVAQPLQERCHLNDSETWLERFKKLENALCLSDIKKTGMLEKNIAKRLIHNYNLILDLSLSPLKIDEAFHKFQTREKVNIKSVLQHLMEL